MATLAEIQKACLALLEMDLKIKRQEDNLKEDKEAARRVREETIPNAMAENKVTSITLEGGQKVTISQEVYASILVANRPKAFAWLNENGFGGMIKTEVKASFGKGEREEAIELSERLQKSGLSAGFTESVAPQTLKAFIKEQISNGNNVPMDLFGARPVMTTKIK